MPFRRRQMREKEINVHRPTYSRRNFMRGALSVVSLVATGCGGSSGHSSSSVGASEPVALTGAQGNAPYTAFPEKNRSVVTLSALPPTALTYRVALNSRG